MEGLMREVAASTSLKRSANAGAVIDFWGVVRGSEDGREIHGIEYETHREMAEHQLKRIAQQASELLGAFDIVLK